MSALLAALLLSAAPAAPSSAAGSAVDRYSTTAFDARADAKSQLDERLAAARKSGKMLLIVMGGNWCHDSAALANLIGSPRFAPMMAQRYEVLFVDVGVPQTGRGRNLDIAARFGMKKLKGTPTVLVVSSAGELINSRKDASSWRNAASRNENDVYRAFAGYADVG